MSGGEDGSARMMHVQNKRVVGTMVHCDAGAVRGVFRRRGGGRRNGVEMVYTVVVPRAAVVIRTKTSLPCCLS